MGPPLKIFQVSLDGILSFRCGNHTTQLGVIYQFTEDAPDPFMYFINEDIKYVLPIQTPAEHHLSLMSVRTLYC